MEMDKSKTNFHSGRSIEKILKILDRTILRTKYYKNTYHNKSEEIIKNLLTRSKYQHLDRAEMKEKVYFITLALIRLATKNMRLAINISQSNHQIIVSYISNKKLTSNIIHGFAACFHQESVLHNFFALSKWKTSS